MLERYVYATNGAAPSLIIRRDGQRLSLVTDSTGSVRAVVDADTGQVLERLDYDAYGRVTRDTDPGLQPFGFKGAVSDPVAQAAGLVWMGVRAYQPELARFVTPDPEGLAAGWNQNDALGGDPINLIDPDGAFFTGVHQLLTSVVNGMSNTVSTAAQGYGDIARAANWQGGSNFANGVSSRLHNAGNKINDWGGHPQWDPCPGSASDITGQAVGSSLLFGAGGAAEGAAEGGAEAAGEDVAGSVEGDAAGSEGGDAAQECLTNSFTSGTLVLMADGKEVEISDVHLGQQVVATDPQTGQTQARPVVELIHHTGLHRMVAITLGDGSVIRATDHHRIWDQTTGTFANAIDIHAGDRLLDASGHTLAVTASRVYEQNLTAYNLQIAGIHTYYVGATPVLVHNACEGGDGQVTTDVKTRPNPGADGGQSVHIIERANGKAISVTHRVETDGEVVHQHQTHIGANGGQRQFPNDWIENPDVG